MNRGPRVMQAISDRANPVVVKELRQAVQSRLVIAILLLFLLANVIIVSAFLVLSIDATTSERAGQDLFGGLFIVLVATCIIFVPLYAAIRLTMERNDSNIDLLFITTIAPGAIVRGKFWAALALTALIYSASTPFLTFTYLLRGIDLPSIFFALGNAFLTTAIAIMLAIFVGSLAGGLLLRILMFGGLLFAGFWMTAYAMAAGLETAEMGLAWVFSGREAWSILGVLLLLALAAWGLLYLLAVAAVSARSSNRMFPIRVFVTAAWLVFGVVSAIWTWHDRSDDPMLIWIIVSVSLLSVILCFTLAERESWTPRVRRHIPRGTLWRFMAWLFYTGSAGGVIWCSVLGVVTLLAGYSVIVTFGAFSLVKSKDELEVLRVMIGIFAYAFCYSMTGLFVRRMIVPKSVPLVGTTIALVLLALGGSLPLLLAYLMQPTTWQFDKLPIGFVIANPFVLERTGADQVVVFFFLFIWAVVGLAVNVPWFLQQWQAFRRYEPKPIPPSAAVAEESPVVHV